MCESRRIRKPVDYSKFGCDEDSDDDFVDSNPSKRTKKEKPTTKSRLSMPVTRLTSSDKVVLAEDQTPKQTASSSSSSTSSPSLLCSLSTDKENGGPSPSLETSVYVKKSSGTSTGDDDDVINTPLSSQDEDIKLIVEESRPTSKEVSACSSTASSRSDATSLKTIHEGRRQPKWQPPGSAQSKCGERRSEVSVNAKVRVNTSPATGLRLGLSRSAKVKSLHANVKS